MGYNRQHTMMKQKLLTLFLALAASVGVLFAQSGTCGANLSWTLDTESSTLTISGTGAMTNYAYAPWYSYRSTIKTVVIKDGVTSIGDYAFAYCSNLISVTIPNSVTSIGKYAFYWCGYLTSITIPNSVTSIGERAFYGCSSLTSITIPNSVTSIGDEAFYLVANIVYNGTATGSPWGARSINGYVDGYFVYSDATKTTLLACFRAAEGELVIPNSIKSIGDNAFRDCTGLTSVTIPNSVTSIGYEAFRDCSSLTSLIIPNSAQFVASGDYKTFNSYINLTYVEAPALFFDIPEGHCPYTTKSLSHVTVNGGELTENALLFINRSYKTLQTLDVSGVTNTEFADEAFKGFYNLKELVLPVMLQKVSYMMVAGCKNLQSVVIPASVEEIEQSAFEDCRSLQSITFGDQQNATPARFNVPASTENRLKHIGNWAFYNAHELKSIEIPEGVEEIGEGAFYGCTYLEDLVLPASVRYVGDNTFALCAKLKKITVNSVTLPSIQAKTFFDVKRQIPVYVPDGSEDDYKAADGWKEFFNIQPITSAPAAIEEMQASEELNGTPRKVLIDGQLYILLPDNTRYNLQGMEVK